MLARVREASSNMVGTPLLYTAPIKDILRSRYGKFCQREKRCIGCLLPNKVSNNIVLIPALNGRLCVTTARRFKQLNHFLSSSMMTKSGFFGVAEISRGTAPRLDKETDIWLSLSFSYSLSAGRLRV